MSGQDFKSLSQERYGKFAERYVTSKTHAAGEELKRLVEIADPQPDWIVLDVATGGGHTALRFAPHVARVIATDITPGMLDKAREFITGQGVSNVTFEPADAEALPFEDASFDLVTCRIAPHHFQDCACFVQESARVLRPGGMLLVQDLALPEDGEAARYIDAFERLRDPSHNRGYAESEWLSMFRAADLVPEHVEQIVKVHQFEPWARRQGCTAETIDELVRLVAEASQPVLAWMQPRNFGQPDASFVNNHILVAGRRPSPEHARAGIGGLQEGVV